MNAEVYTYIYANTKINIDRCKPISGFSLAKKVKKSTHQSDFKDADVLPKVEDVQQKIFSKNIIK